MAALLFILTAQRLSAAVVINEIHYDPDVKTEPAEFIELFNTSPELVNLSGWRLTEAVTYTFPNDTWLPGNGYVVIAQHPPTILSKFGVNALGPWNGLLDNDGEQIVLRNAAGGVEDEVDYQLGFPWPTVGDTPGYSIELINPAFDNNLGGNWRASVIGAPQSQTLTLLPDHSSWRFLRGTNEASNPTTAWRALTFNDSQWEYGPAPIGYEPTDGLPMGTRLSDMNGNYRAFFLRTTFVVQDPAALSTLTLQAMYDDGFKLWINSSNLVSQKLPTGEVAYDALATGSARESSSYDSFPLAPPAHYLRAGTNVIAIQVHNILLSGSSDCFFDARLVATTGTTGKRGPTPNAPNAVFNSNGPPQLRQVEHTPDEPRSGQPVLLTAKVTDPHGVNSVTLRYQVVSPGSYIELTDAAYTNTWTSLSMNDAGVNGDQFAGDSVYSCLLPPQPHRTLVRYRVAATDSLAASITTPYPDDPQPNFAYFVYDGVPAWRGAVRPGVPPVLDFDTNVMQRLPVVHLLAKYSAVTNATWGRYSGDLYLWSGTLVYDGRVYDHIHYRMRGGVWRYAMVKNMWKFDFNRGHDLQMRDDWGRKYSTKWTKLNLGACIQQGNYGHRGEQGMFESVGFRLFNLAGVPGCNTTFLQFRIIDDALETSPTTQYEGDFWGLYLAVEQEDGRFLDEHGLPDGNFYKMDSGVYPYPYGDLNNQGATGVTDKSDLTAFISGLNANSALQWWQTNWWIPNGCSYQAIVQAIHHYDIGGGKNYFYYLNPETHLWNVIPWDLDLTWASNMYDAGGQGGEPFKLYAIPIPAIGLQYRNRVREIRDLLWNTDQAWQLIDEYAWLLRGPTNGPTFLDADRCQWDYNPKMNPAAGYTSHPNNHKAEQGLFYQWTNEPTVSKDFNGCIQLMKNYVSGRVPLLESLGGDPYIPARPTLEYIGPPGFPLNQLTFRCSAYNSSYASFAAVNWRIGEVLDTNAPAFDPSEPQPYEITAQWETTVSNTFLDTVGVPVGALKVGHAYRARVQMVDATGRTSRWSLPVQFIAGLPDNAGTLAAFLQISELMYHPPDGEEFEFIELCNASTNLTLNLEGAAYTSGIDYTFPGGTTLAPGAYLLLIRNPDASAFRNHYGLPPDTAMIGPYIGSLANQGEELTLKTGAGGLVVFSFDFANGRGWPVGTKGAGHSLVPLASAAPGRASGALDYPGNWRASTFLGGSPGRADPPAPAPSLLINELTAHTDHRDPLRPEYDSNDWLELFNTTGTDLLLSDWYLSDDPGDLRKWRIPPTTIAPARGWLTFSEIEGFHDPITTGFGLDKAGEQLLLSHLPGDATDRVVDAVAFKGQENEASLSRVPDGAPWWFASVRTSNSVNAAQGPKVLISELMYRPPDLASNDNTRDEFIELFNVTASTLYLQDTNGPWRLDGGVSFTFPLNTPVPPGGVLLVVNFDPNDSLSLAAFRNAYSFTNTSVGIYGPYSGKLGNRSDRVALEKPQYPDLPGEPYSWVIVDDVIYGNQFPWPSEANGQSASLQRLSILRSGNDPANWHAASPTPGLAPPLDGDGDGMPDDWEFQYSLRPDDPTDASADPDGDGMANLQEFLSGTDPRNAASVLRFESVAVSGDEVRLVVRALKGRSYTIQSQPAVDHHQYWEKLEDIPPDAEQDRLVEISAPLDGAGARFYRLVTPALP